MKYILSFILILFIGLSTGFGQKVTYYGEVIDMDSEKDLNGTVVRVLLNGTEVSKTIVDKGRYTLQFSAGKEYTIEYSKAGYVSKMVKVDVTKVIEEDMPPGGKIFPAINIDLFKERPGVDFSFLKTEPVASWYFDRDKMNWDSRQAANVKKKITDKLNEAPKTENNDAEYNALIQEADQMFNNKQYEAALGKYSSALRVSGKEKEKHPSNRILEIGDILQKKAEDELDFRQENQAYINLIEAADNLANKKEYAKAVAKYEEAISLKSDEQYPKDRVRELKDIVDAEKNREKYDDLVKRGDMFLKQNSLEAARDKFQEASNLMKNEQYPKDKLAEIAEKLDAQSAIREKKEKYNEAVEAADKLYDKGEFEEAIAKYDEALTYESAASYPIERKKMAQTKMDEQKAEKEKLANFTQLVKEGDDGVADKKYEIAVAKYVEALALIDDAEVKVKRDNAQQLLKELKENAEKQEAFDQLVKAGDLHVEGKKYQDAIAKYDEALTLIDDAAVKSKKESAQQLLTLEQENAQKMEAFNQLVKAGDDEVKAKNYETAIAKFNEAIGLIDDEGVKTKRDNAQKLFNEANKQQAFDNLVAEATEKVNAKEYQTAIAKFDEALAIMDNQAVQKSMADAQKALDAMLANQEKEAQIASLMASAENKMNATDYTGAIADFSEVLKLDTKNAAAIDGKKNAENLLTEIANQSAKEEKITGFLASAQGKMTAEDYKGAIADFTEVLNLDPQNPTAIEGKGNAERLLADLADQSAKEAQFAQLVTDADKAFNDKKYDDAKTKYLAAKAIFGDRAHVNDRIDEISGIVQQLANKERTNADIQVLLDQAANLKPDNKWGQVIQKYEEALGLDNTRIDISELLNQAKASKQAWDAKQSQDELFTQLKFDGETFMANKKWLEAKAKFDEALGIKDDADIRTQLGIITQKLAEEAANQSQEANYQAKMSEGENLASSDKYTEAIGAFNAALQYKKDDPVAKSRIADMEQKLANQANLAIQNEEYERAMKAGREAMVKKDYSEAIKSFDDALLVKPTDMEATKLKEEAKEFIRNLQNEEQQFNAFMADGESLLEQARANNNNVPTLESSKEKFKNAQRLRPEASAPQSKIVEIDNLLRQIQEEEELNAAANAAAISDQKYQEKIELADVAAQNKQYQNAINHLKDAKDLKPSETYPIQKIKEYQEILDAIAAKDAVESKYNGFIQQADLAFSNKQYDQSIALYNQALGVKQNETYPLSQIEKAKEGLKNLESQGLEQQYQSFVNKGDQQFSNKQYEAAIQSYQSALGIKKEDKYATDKIDETKQILKNLAENNAAESANRAKFDALISTADRLYNSEDYLAAKKAYDNALVLYPNDLHAIERAQLCVLKSKEKTERENNALYDKIVSKADDYFGKEDYDKAEELYNRALKLRTYDRYPQDKIDEIYSIRNANVKANSEIEYLGEKSNISILEGAALLEAGERLRDQLKKDAVEQQIRKNEGLEADLTVKDQAERYAYENEITAIKDRRDKLHVDESGKHNELIQGVDDTQKELADKKEQLDNYLKGDITHTYKNIEYIEQEFDDVKSKLGEDHQEMIELVKEIEKSRESQDKAEMAHHQVKALSTREELLKTEKRNENLDELNNIKQRDLEVKVDDLEKARELRVFEDANDLYEDVKKIEAYALLAEMKLDDSHETKMAIHKHLQDDLYALDATLQRKLAQGDLEAYERQLELDGKVLSAENQYAEAMEGKDDDRLRIIEEVKMIDAGQDNQTVARSDKHYEKTQAMTAQADVTLNLLDEQASKQKEDLAKIDNKVKSQISALDRAAILKDEAEKNQSLKTEIELEQIRKQEEMAAKDNSAKQQSNSEEIKSLTSYLETKSQEEVELVKKDQLKTQKIAEQLEQSKLTYTEKIANTIGDEFPEGVSQENYVRKDDKGIPYQIVTRRFVVENGHGEIYIRIQTRNGITYSKNGMPTTEESWIRGTESSHLKKHF